MDQASEQLRTVIKEELQTFNDKVFLPAFGKYTEEIVLPAIETVRTELGDRIETVRTELGDRIETVRTELNGRIGKLQSDTIDFVTRQINDAKGEIIRAIREERERDRVFKRTVVEILERNHLASAEESDLLRGLLSRPA